MKVKAYMCTTEYNWHLKDDPDGACVYGMLKDLKRERACWRECGIVQIEIKKIKQVVKGKF